MKHKLELEVDVITDASPLEVAAKLLLVVQEAMGRIEPSVGTELGVDVFLVLDGDAVRLVMEPV